MTACQSACMSEEGRNLQGFATLPRLVLLKLPADEASGHAEAIVRRLDDPCSLVRRAAFDAIARLLPGVLWQRVQPVIRRLEDVDDQVRQHALEALGSMPAEVVVRHVHLLAQYVGLFVQRLSDDHGHVRFFAQRTLGKLPKQLVAAHAGEMASALETASAGARIAMLSVLTTIAAETLSPCAERMIRQLSHPAWGVRLAAVRALGSLAPTELKVCAACVLVCAIAASFMADIRMHATFRFVSGSPGSERVLV
mmetsp:Transcript_23905/g.55456  ORF Transcript_23905/g.55456 Transcript_23905/m.55456 type:complete len:253 (-) Transcript_23905:527-1285(-)